MQKTLEIIVIPARKGGRSTRLPLKNCSISNWSWLWLNGAAFRSASLIPARGRAAQLCSLDLGAHQTIPTPDPSRTFGPRFSRADSIAVAASRLLATRFRTESPLTLPAFSRLYPDSV